ncbi:hypothetical protein L198_03978 [Cryptococcus wingfieldii CBS 7118]|uniref:Mitochondrial protein n=1 Tax=Cryptococcus wingfieldii CBS 7118 TaxID=1295528 RepID=A0A1E3J978_9TREE|nr:hypothetical protein L198_03978 [Cryptococcus wingfieldii CBS 7118]ODN97414.1 hypothetical protein L198_03978 [Cryptococcus wingfieldii CBS 7118]
MLVRIPRLATRASLASRCSIISSRALSTQNPSTPTPEIFSSKATPRETLHRPEAFRGMPSSGRTVDPNGAFDSNNPHKGKIFMGVDPKSKEEVYEAFNGPSKPRLIYERPGGRDLPKAKSVVPFVVALGLLGLGWGLFILHATNTGKSCVFNALPGTNAIAERLSSSVLRQVTFQMRNSPDVMSVLGDNVKLVEEWWALGSPWISGTINLMQGRVDLSARLKGERQAGTVYFTSIRPQSQGAWRIGTFLFHAGPRKANLESSEIQDQNAAIKM